MNIPYGTVLEPRFLVCIIIFFIALFSVSGDTVIVVALATY